MSQSAPSSPLQYWEAHFISSSSNPREKLHVFASAADGMEQRCFAFETPHNHMGTRTSVIQLRGEQEPGHEVATLDWDLDRFLGWARFYDRERVLMAALVERQGPGDGQNHRSFHTNALDGSTRMRCTWVKKDDGIYELWSGRAFLADFHPTQEWTPIGTSWGTLRYWFTQEELFLEAIVTLAINRWIDLQGL